MAKKKHHGIYGKPPKGSAGHGGGTGGLPHNLPHRYRHLIHGIYNEGAGGTSQPPSMAYDPAIEAQRRAAQLGAKQLVEDTYTKQHQARQDYRTTRHDYIVKRRRGRQDYGTQLRRGLLGLHQKKVDERLTLSRGKEDFTTRLTNLGRTFGILASRQSQAANAAGVNDAGTNAAAAAARAQNYAVARQPLDTGLQRLKQNTQTNIHRIGIEGSQLHQDVRRGLGRLTTDTHHDVRLAHRDLHRTITANRRTLLRGLEQQQIGDLSLRQEEIFNARQNYPGAFSTTGTRTKKHVPGVPGG